MNRTAVILSAVVASLLFVSQASARDVLLAYPSSGVELKSGWNTFSGEKTSVSCVEAGEVNDPGQRRFVNYTEVSDQSSLSQAFSMSASANVQAGVARVGGSISMSRSFSLTVTGLNLAVQAQILYGPRFLVPLGTELEAQRRLQLPSADAAAETIEAYRTSVIATGDRSIRLRREYQEMAVREPARFRKDCGDAFVSMVAKSSGIQGVVTATTRNEEERKSVNASFRGSYGPASGDASVNATMARLASEGRIAIEYVQLGGQGLPIAISADEFRKLIRDIGEKATEDSASRFRMAITPYSSLPDYRGKKTENTVVEAIANQYLRLSHLARYLTDATTNTERYYFDDIVTEASVRDVESDVQSARSTLQASLKTCVASPRKCSYPRVPKTDWGYRSKLPIPRQEATAFNDLQAAIPALAAAEQQRKNYPPTDRSCGGLFNDDCPYSANPNYARLTAEIERLSGVINSLAQVRPYEEQRFYWLIAAPRQQRCDNDEDSCITANQAEEFRKRMTILRQ